MEDDLNANVPLLRLPTEILDHIFDYLDWDRDANLFPIKPDIISASLVCKALRTVLVPVLFRDVVLRLRWLDGTLVEPCLFTLRRDFPDVAKHIRCVFIRTEFEQCPHCAALGDPAPFILPAEIDDWTNPSGSGHVELYKQGMHRARADAIAQRFQPDLGTLQDKDRSAEEIIRDLRDLPQRSQELGRNADALAIVMLCIPTATHTIVFQSLPDDNQHMQRNQFALRVLTTAIEVQGSTLKDLTLVSTAAIGMIYNRLRMTHGSANMSGDRPLLAPEVVEALRIKRLTFALADRSFASNRSRATQLSYESVRLWHGASDWLRELNIRNTSSEFNEMLRSIKGFQSLELIRFQEAAIFLPSPGLIQNPGGGRTRAEPQQNTWLVFLIELRQAMQHVKIEASKLYTFHTHTEVRELALRWILGEAVPSGALINADRQERLLQDYESFLPLWEAEESDRGSQALESWETQRSKLSDEAMSRRWR